MGALVTLELPAESPVRDLPWIITIGPLTEDEEWEAIVVGPYEHGHALALAEEIVADEQLMAVVEPVAALVSVEAIREEIAVARAAALKRADEEEDDDSDSDVDAEYGEGEEGDEQEEGHAGHEGHVGPPTSEEVRAGVARIAARLLADHLSGE